MSKKRNILLGWRDHISFIESLAQQHSSHFGASCICLLLSPPAESLQDQAGEMFAVVHIFSLKWEQNNLKISFDPIKDI